MKKIQILIPFVFFILLLCAAFVLYDDYGGFTDELSEINVSATNFKYILTKLNLAENFPVIPTVDSGKLADLPQYQYRYYGSAVMMPSLFVNMLPGTTMDTAQFLNFRRLYTFLNFYLALICCYFIFRVRFKNGWIAILGTAMLTLTPRLFAESFYNGKDMIFFSWFLISLFGISYYLMKNSIWGLVIFCIAFGLTVNTRNYGIILWPAFLTLGFINWRQKPDRQKKDLIPVIATGFISIFFYYLFTPFLWSDPIRNFIDSIKFSANQVGIGDAELFMGKFITPGNCWYYIPVWMGITIPVLYILFFLIKLIFLGKELGGRKFVFPISEARLFDLFCLFLIIFSYIGIVLSHAVIYHGWRHSYFLYGPFIILSVGGLANLWNLQIRKENLFKLKNALLFCICLISFASTGFWIVKNHPLDFVYFNEIGRHYARQFTRDYWGVASKSCIRDLAGEYDYIHPIMLGVNADLTYGSTQNSLLRFPAEIQERFQVVWKNNNAEYLCFSYKNIPGNDHPIPGFEIMKSYRVDGYDVAAIYKRNNNN